MENNSTNYNEILDNSDEKILIKFSTKWCGPCKTYSPIFEQFITENPSVKCLSIDCNEEPDIAHKFNVMSIPTTMVVKNRKELIRKVGILQKEDLSKLLE